MEGDRPMMPTGIDDFREVRENHYCFIDKSELISHVVRNMGKTFLFTRPRRFGKSLNLSMIDAFFNRKYRDNHWFDGLKVMNDPKAVSMMNDHSVLSISLKDMRGDSYSNFLEDFTEIIQDVADNYRYLRGSDSVAGMKVLELMDREAPEAALRRSLRNITKALYEHHGTKVIILVDEYDDVINRSFGKDCHEQILSFLRSLLGTALKSNPYMMFGVVTGVMQITKENLFSGLNNLYTNNIFDKEYSDMFGFTESEVSEILTRYGHSEKLDEVREWYDGYRFGDAEIYNPWSIISYIDRGFEADTHWINTGNPDLILESMSMVGPDALRIVTELYNDNKAEAELNMKMIFTDLGSMNGFLSLLTGSGYLKAIPLEERRWELLLVNREVRAGLLDQLVSGRRETDNINEISRAILSGSPDEVRTQLSKSLDAHMDGKLCRDERYYQAFYLGLLNCLTKRYYVKSEYSSGKGNSDIALIPRDGKGPFAILELKDEPGNTGDERMIKVSEGALNQIFDLRYFADLHGELHLYGIATRQKDVFVTYRKIIR